MKNKLYKIEDPIYETNLGIYIGEKEKFNQYLDNLGLSDHKILKVTTFAKTICDKGYSLIYLPNINSIYAVGALIHELHHFCCYTFEDRKIPISQKNDEAMAYYKAMIFRNIAKKLNLCVSLGSQKLEMKKK